MQNAVHWFGQVLCLALFWAARYFPKYAHKLKLAGLYNKMSIAICIGSKASEKLDDVVINTRLLLDMKKLSPLYQTSSLKAYHSVVNHFAPKLLAFSDHGMHARYLILLNFVEFMHYTLHRLLIAALHFNESWEQARTTDGTEHMRICFPKS